MSRWVTRSYDHQKIEKVQQTIFKIIEDYQNKNDYISLTESPALLINLSSKELQQKLPTDIWWFMEPAQR